MTLVKRKIDVAFTLGEGAFGESGSNTVTLSGLRTSCTISQAGGTMAQLEMRIWGVRLEVMQRLTVLNKLAYEQERANSVTVMAGDSESGMAVAFTGTIKEAWADASNAPEMVFVVSAFTGGLDSIRPVPATSYDGPASADTLFSYLASQMIPPRTLENNGVTGVLDSQYIPGTIMHQLRTAQRAFRCNMAIEDKVVAIWPAGKARNSLMLDVSASTGMVGYPQFTQDGIALTMLYNPALRFGQGIKVTSALAAANGSWAIAALTHNLDAELPGGQWFSHIHCGLMGHELPIIG